MVEGRTVEEASSDVTITVRFPLDLTTFSIAFNFNPLIYNAQQHEELLTEQQQNALHSPTPSTLCGSEVAQDEQLLDETMDSVKEPSIETAANLNEPGNGTDSTEINTSGSDEHQQEEHQQEEKSSTAESIEVDSIQQAAAESEVAVASGPDNRPVVAVNNREIEQENIKHKLHEIISEIDREMEADDLSNEEVSVATKTYILIPPSRNGFQPPGTGRRRLTNLLRMRFYYNRI